MPYDPNDIASIDAYIGDSYVNERGRADVKLPGYFEGVSFEWEEPLKVLAVRNGRGEGIGGVLVRAVDTATSNEFEDITSQDGGAQIQLANFDVVHLTKDKAFATFAVSYASDIILKFEPPNYNPE
jgi:hypothetical protein